MRGVERGRWGAPGAREITPAGFISYGDTLGPHAPWHTLRDETSLLAAPCMMNRHIG